MQTFLPFKSFRETFQCLDNKRLGKQRVEAIQILRRLLGITKGWKNHPAVKMWKGYEGYLLGYIDAAIRSYAFRGFKNKKCLKYYEELKEILYTNYSKYEITFKCPEWLSEDFCIAHRSNLVRKYPEYYKYYFDVKNDLPYIWPTKKGENNE